MPRGGGNGAGRAALRTALFALVPAAALLGAAEAGLRLARPAYLEVRSADAQYRYKPYALRRVRADGAEIPPGEAVPEEDLSYASSAPKGRGFLVPAEKGEEFRVLVLGESSVYGWPYPPGDAFPAKAEDALRRATGERRPIRVVNGGVTGEWSAQVLARLEGAAVLRPDWVVLYLGHNDCVRLHELLRPPPPWARAAQGALHRSWLYRWLAARGVKARHLYNVWEDIPGMDARKATLLWASLPLENPLMNWEEWAPPPADAADPARRRLAEYEAAAAWIARLYARNVEAAVRRAREAGARVLLVTPVSRLHEAPPFDSEHLAALSGDDARRWEEALARGDAAAERGDFAEAERAYREAAAISPTHAMGEYKLGEALRALGRWSEAREALALAREYDLSGSRSRAFVVRALREIAAREDVSLLDLEREWADCERCRGPEYFNDELHPSREGHAAIGARLAEFLTPYVSQEP